MNLKRERVLEEFKKSRISKENYTYLATISPKIKKNISEDLEKIKKFEKQKKLIDYGKFKQLKNLKNLRNINSIIREFLNKS